MSNEELYEQVTEAISELFSDMSVSKTQTKENLNNLIGEIKIMLESLGE